MRSRKDSRQITEAAKAGFSERSGCRMEKTRGRSRTSQAAQLANSPDLRMKQFIVAGVLYSLVLVFTLENMKHKICPHQWRKFSYA